MVRQREVLYTPLSLVRDPVLSVRLTSYTSGEMGLLGMLKQYVLLSLIGACGLPV